MVGFPYWMHPSWTWDVFLTPSLSCGDTTETRKSPMINPKPSMVEPQFILASPLSCATTSEAMMLMTVVPDLAMVEPQPTRWLGNIHLMVSLTK